MLEQIAQGGIMPLIERAVSTSDSALTRKITETLRGHGYRYNEVVQLFRDCADIDEAEYEELLEG